MYTHSMKELFQKILVELPNETSPKQKYKYLLHAIGGVLYTDILLQKLPPQEKRKLSLKNKKR